MDPMAIVDSVGVCAAGALQNAGATVGDVAGVAVTNQRESTVVWDRRTGAPLYDCILWHDARTASTSAMLEEALGGRDALRHSCGLPISTYFSGVKLRWLMDNVPEVKQGMENGTALFGTVDSWILWNLTGGAAGGALPTYRLSPAASCDQTSHTLIAVGKSTRHVTDVSNASRTLMMRLDSCEWDAALVDALGLRAMRDALPEIVSSAEAIGRVADGGARSGGKRRGGGSESRPVEQPLTWRSVLRSGPLEGAMLSGCIGDQQSAMVGQRCFNVGNAKIT